ncbi:hypothetical protein OAF98_02975 [Planctomicrobium sp.]|nr:hypothetical protein [Planctomicrobium sp.]MDA7503458.1 hypothetical protein [bacterium]MDB4743425.1 hypothetical protein [Planctomicrobium sp.]
MKTCLCVFTSMAAISILAGCGGGDGFSRVPFSGTVTLNGDGNQAGSIVGTADSQSTASGSSEVPTVQAAIIDGKFEFLGDDRPVAGPYKFEIYMAVPDENSADDGGQSVPEDANETGGNTVAYTKLVVVPDGGSESFSLEVTDADLAQEGGVTASGEQ